MSNDRNHWITFVGHTVAGWEAVVPPPRGDASELIRIGRVFVEAGERHAVWDVERFASAQDFEATITTAVRERARVPLVFRALDAPETCAPARLAFHRDDRIVEEVVADVGLLLRTLRADRPPSVTRSAPPIVVTGASVALDSAAEVRLEIRLDTDIWFPRVMGFAEPGDEPPDGYDNYALAARHTPRLNAFLAEVAAATAAAGGQWRPIEVDGIARNYVDQWDATGVLLDA